MLKYAHHLVVQIREFDYPWRGVGGVEHTEPHSRYVYAVFVFKDETVDAHLDRKSVV